jgi:hypothetical protein
MATVMDSILFVMPEEREEEAVWEFTASPSNKSLQQICICSRIFGSSINVTLQGVGGFSTERDVV